MAIQSNNKKTSRGEFSIEDIIENKKISIKKLLKKNRTTFFFHAYIYVLDKTKKKKIQKNNCNIIIFKNLLFCYKKTII